MDRSVRSRTLIHEVVGLNLAVTLSVLPKGWGSDLHLGQFHRADKEGQNRSRYCFLTTGKFCLIQNLLWQSFGAKISDNGLFNVAAACK